MHTRTARKHGAWLLLIGLGIGLSVGLWSAAGSAAEEAAKSSRSVLGGVKPTESSKSKAKEDEIAKKLDEILANQQTILQRFDQVMEELRIIKVRATLHGSRS